ncbi:MAG TPA: serine/threonine-protein kinase [Planctomycetota bacterium]
MTLDARAFKGLSRFLAPSAGGPLADRALTEKLITHAQLQECVEEQDRTGLPLDEILVARGILPRVVVDRLRQPHLPPEVVEAAMDPKRVLNKYVLVSRAGQGGMAEVWKAWDRSLGRWVAVKFLKEEVGQPEQRIEREGRMAAGLSHPGIISIYERARHDDGRPYLVMPFVEGSGPACPLPPREAARIGMEVARALAHTHAMKVIHRDVKPANILIGPEGRVVLADFGLAMPASSPASRWAVSGTPEYASPEQVRGDVLDPGTDIYSLGATLFHLLEGRPPFGGLEPKEIVERVLHAPFPRMPSTPPALAAVVRRAMERDRKARFATMTELADALKAVADGPAATRGPTVRTLALVVVVGLLPWAFTWMYMVRERASSQRQEVERPLRLGLAELAEAERLTADDDPAQGGAAAAASRAVAFFRRSLGEAGTDVPEALCALGRSFELLGQEGRAHEAWERAGDLPEARLGLARLWLRRHLDGRREYDWREAARDELKLAATGQPEDPSPALALFCEGKWAEALAAAGPARATRRSDDVFQLALGIAAGHLKRWKEADEYFTQALRLKPQSPSVYFHFGVGHAEGGRKEEAAACFEAALQYALPGWNLEKDAKTRLAALR